jgi:hypothetical protein
MSQLNTRPASRQDIENFIEEISAEHLKYTPTMRAWVVEHEGRAMALGGIAYIGGHHMGFFELKNELRAMIKKNMYLRVYWVKITMNILKELKEDGIRYIFADAESHQPKADLLLEKLGFKLARSGKAYRWSAT